MFLLFTPVNSFDVRAHTPSSAVCCLTINLDWETDTLVPHTASSSLISNLVHPVFFSTIYLVPFHRRLIRFCIFILCHRDTKKSWHLSHTHLHINLIPSSTTQTLQSDSAVLKKIRGRKQQCYFWYTFNSFSSFPPLDCGSLLTNCQWQARDDSVRKNENRGLLEQKQWQESERQQKWLRAEEWSNVTQFTSFMSNITVWWEKRLCIPYITAAECQCKTVLNIGDVMHYRTDLLLCWQNYMPVRRLLAQDTIRP